MYLQAQRDHSRLDLRLQGRWRSQELQQVEAALGAVDLAGLKTLHCQADTAEFDLSGAWLLHNFLARVRGAGISAEFDGAPAVRSITAEMGRATFRSGQIPATGPDREIVGEPVEAAGERLRITAVSVGNPHCVVFVDDPAAVDLPRLGPALEHHPMFPNRINVQFVRVDSPHKVTIRIWERGAGETTASGSSSSAVAAACVRQGRTGRDLAVHSPGGVLRVEVGPDYALRLTGPVEEVSRGTLSPDLLSRLRRGRSRP